MPGPIYMELEPVRRRQKRLLVFRTAVLGLLAASAAGIVLGLGRWWGDWPVAAWMIVLVLAAGLGLGALAGLLRKCTWKAAALAVDAHYGLKDRSATALEFVNRPEPTVYHELQVLDARSYLRVIEARAVAPLRLPRAFPYAVAALVLAVLLAVWPLKPRTAEAAVPEPLQAVLEVAEDIAENLKEFDELAREDNNQALARLVEQLRQKVEELKRPGVSERDALAKISEMQAALADQLAQHDIPLVDNQLHALGEAMTPAASLENAGKALQEGKYDQAAKELDKVQEEQLDRKDAKAAHEKLEQAAKALKDANLGALSAATAKMAQGLKGAKGQLEKGSRDLARQVRNHDRRRRINHLLALQQDRLNECKSRCRNSYMAWIQQKQKKQEGSGAGAAKGDQPLGEKSSLAGLRQLKEIPGNPGDDGPVDVETTRSSDEGADKAARRYREVYQKYRQMSDAVLEHEPIPLGHRQTIRAYFELIHPRNVDGQK